MATRSWIGGTGYWTDPSQWLGAIAPQPDDTEIVGDGTVKIAAGETIVAADLQLGSGYAADPAVLFATDANFDYRSTIDSTAAASFASFIFQGVVGFNGVINATASGGNFTLYGESDDAGANNLVLLDGSAVDVSGGDTMELAGTLTNNSSVVIGSGGDFINSGTITQSSAAFSVDSGGTLSGGGVFDIGFYSSLYFAAGAAPSAQSVRFTDVAGRLFLADPAAYTGMISNFQQGDLIDLTGIVANYATYDADTAILTVENDGSLVATLNVQGPSSGVLMTMPDTGTPVGTIIEIPGTLARVTYTLAADDRAMQADVARATLTTADDDPITGAGIKIGIISSSFDEAPGSGSADVANAAALAGYLPLDATTGTSAVKVLTDDLYSGDDNEGLAMAELAHQVAPGAALYFATGEGGLGGFAAAVEELQTAGCNIIVDDISYDEEPFFQNADVLDTVIEGAVADGVSYFTAAGNAGTAAFQAAFAPQATVLSDGTDANAEIFDNGTPYQAITLQAGVTTTIALQWAAPWPAAGATVEPLLTAALYDSTGALVATSRPVNGAPEVELSITPGATTQYQLAIYGALEAGTEFKYMLLGTQNGGSTIGGTIDDPQANAGTVKGHAMLPDVNAVGAVDFTAAAAFGGDAAATEYYSATGPAELLFDSAGNALATPTIVDSPDFVAPVDAGASLTRFQPFGGTSAAAPNAAAVAALMLQADPSLTPGQITAMLEESATNLGLATDQQGAGMVNADAAVQLALAAACYAAGTRIATPRGLVPIERLRVGDQVLTEAGAAQAIIWVGRRLVACRDHPRPLDVWPIRVQAHAFAPQIPARDVLLSPDHAVKAESVLIPIRYLVNGATVAQVARPAVEYWHVELARHEMLLAEGLPAESYLDTGNRAAFEGGAPPPADRQTDTSRTTCAWAERGCAPLVVDGPIVAATHTSLLARAARLGHAATRAPDLRLRVGKRTVAATVERGAWRARLPAGTRRVILASRTWVPAQFGEPDHRILGVAISGLTLDGSPVPLDDARLSAGWEAAEPDWRWTIGAGIVDTGGARDIAFEVVMTGRYWQAPASEEGRNAVTPAKAGHQGARGIAAMASGLRRRDA